MKPVNLNKKNIIRILITLVVTLFILPRIMVTEHFACSDYCPGPEEQYLVKVYPIVFNSAWCRLIGGDPGSYNGWGEFNICRVK